MLAYCKVILLKMRFSKKLFLKEYRKSFSYLGPGEQEELKRWVRDPGENDSAPQQLQPLAVREQKKER